MLAVAVWVQGSSCIMWCSKVLPEGILLKSLICQRDPVGKSSGGGTPASFLYYDYRDDFHDLHARLKGSGGNAERSCSTLLQIIPFCSPTLPVGRSQCRFISSPKTCLSLQGHGFPYWAGTQSNVSQVHIASESYCMYEPMMCRNASVEKCEFFYQKSLRGSPQWWCTKHLFLLCLFADFVECSSRQGVHTPDPVCYDAKLNSFP